MPKKKGISGVLGAVKTIIAEKKYQRGLAPQIKERQAYSRAMRGGSVGGLSNTAAGFAAKRPAKIKWPVR